MANRNLTPVLILKEFMSHVRNELTMVNLVYRDFDAEISNRKEGDTVYVRRPLNFTVTEGVTFSAQDIEQAQVPVKVDKRFHIGLNFTSDDMSLNMPEFVRKTAMAEAARTMAQKIDLELQALYKDVYCHVGTVGQTVNSIGDFIEVPKRLDLLAVPGTERHAVMSPTDGWGLIGSQTSALSEKLVEEAYINGGLGNLAGVKTYRTQQVRTHTVGTFGGTPLVNGANQNVTYAASADTWSQTLATDGWTSGGTALKKGDIFTIAGVYAVNPSNKDTLAHLQQFVIKADVTDTAGAAALTISPPIITTGPYQTVSAAPANDAAITMLGTSAGSIVSNLAFHRNAFAFVPVPLYTDSAMPVVAQVTDSTQSTRLKGAPPGTGLSFRMVRDYTLSNDSIQTRIDTLFGVKAIRPELATRFNGTA